MNKKLCLLASSIIMVSSLLSSCNKPGDNSSYNDGRTSYAIEGIVQGNDGTFLEGVTITLTKISSKTLDTIEVNTNKDGYYIFENLTKGTYSFEVEPNTEDYKFETNIDDVTLSGPYYTHKISNIILSKTGFDINGYTVKGKIRDNENNYLKDVTIILAKKVNNATQNFKAISNDNGEYEFTSLQSGTYSFKVIPPNDTYSTESKLNDIVLKDLYYVFTADDIVLKKEKSSWGPLH